MIPAFTRVDKGRFVAPVDVARPAGRKHDTVVGVNVVDVFGKVDAERSNVHFDIVVDRPDVFFKVA